jgi:predicted AlkP superfamily phosphohydrolase/phosphomutase
MCLRHHRPRAAHVLRAKDRGGLYSGVIEDLYIRADRLVGKAFQYVDEQTALFVLSDHGFASFERGADLNAWLLQHGYLALKPGASGEASYLKDIDWEHTRAYTFGLAGIYINQRGTEAQGIVAPGAPASALKLELAAKLSGLRDEERDRVAIRKAWPSESLYTTVSRCRARSHHRICRRLPRLLGRRRRQGERGGVHR